MEEESPPEQSLPIVTADAHATPETPHAPVLTGVLLFVASAVLFFGLGYMTFLIGGRLAMGPYRLLVIVSQFAGLFLPAALLATTLPGGLRGGLRLRKAPLGSVVAAIVGSVCVYAVMQVYLLAQEIYLIPESWMKTYMAQRAKITEHLSELLLSDDPWMMALIVAMVVVTPAICEESLCRGAIQGSFERRLRPATAILFAASLFALMHMQPVNFVALAMIGIFFGYVAWRTGSIIPSMAAHAAFNGLTLLAMRLAPAPRAERPHTPKELLGALPLGAAGAVLLLIIIYWLNRSHAGRGPALLEQ